MRVKKLTETQRINKIIAKDEPQFQILVDLDKMELCHALNWYSQYRDKLDSHRYLREYCKENSISVTEDQIDVQVSTLGFVARLLYRGAKLDDKSILWFNTRMKQMQKFVSVNKKVVSTEERKKPTQEQIAEAMKLATGKCIADLEHCVDDFISSEFKTSPNISNIIDSHNLSHSQYPNILETFKKSRNELRSAISEGLKDRQSEEFLAYNPFTIVELKKLESFYDNIVSEVVNRTEAHNAVKMSKSPRKKKVKSPEAQVKRVKYLTEDAELKIKSIDPKLMVGASSLWTYHVPTRMLTQYISDDDSGFSVKGCAILNYSKVKSQSKKLR